MQSIKKRLDEGLGITGDGLVLGIFFKIFEGEKDLNVRLSEKGGE